MTEAEHIINLLAQQRNGALDQLVAMAAKVQMLQEKIKELESKPAEAE